MKQLQHLPGARQKLVLHLNRKFPVDEQSFLFNILTPDYPL